VRAHRRQVGIVPHTHWDREWYAPFQAYRLQLVHLVDGLLDLLERDDAFTRFLLDGQTTVVDDYLEVRPEAEARIRDLVGAGRVQVGPWMVLMDEFMVSGETMIRDLQLGLARANDLGGAMAIGYLPDMFGHIAQMPQLLRLAGLEHAVVWRGVPAAVDRTAFWWVAPDGSRVRAEYLYGSYSNGRDLPDDPDQLVARARNYELELGGAALEDGGLLLMNGSDHLRPQPHLPRVVAAANAAQDRYEFTITSLPEYLAAQPVAGLPTWCGELRSGARANVLMGVASNRVDVHQLAAAAERALERRAEPLAALFLPPSQYPDTLFRLAWQNLVLNSAHDSSCACSHDDVVDAVRVRYQDARHLADALRGDALAALASEVDVPSWSVVVVNASPTARAGTVTVELPDDGAVHLVALDDDTPCATQTARTRAREGLSTVVAGQKIRWVLELMRGPEFAGARIARVSHELRDDGIHEYTFHELAPGDTAIDLEPVREELLALGEQGATIAVRQRRTATREVVFAARDVPAFGWRSYRVAAGDGPTTPARAEGTTLANEYVVVEVDASAGTFALEADGVRVVGANRYVDGGDGGDTYNYSPPIVDRIVDEPDTVSVQVLESGPVRARLVITARYHVPIDAVGDERYCERRNEETVALDIRTQLELRTGERFLRVRVDVDNRASDHRLRAHFPLPTQVHGSDAECAFAVVRRGLTAEGGPHEAGLPTFVSRRFVDCSEGGRGLALLHDGLLEYEIVDDGRELALTLLRATGYLSRAEPALRPNPAGPLDPVVGPQLQRTLAFEYALLPHRGNWEDARVDEAADDFLVPLELAHTLPPTAATRPAVGSALEVDGAAVSAVLRDTRDGPLVVRLVNRSASPTTADVRRDGRPAVGEVVDLRGRAQAKFSGSLELGPWQIATLRLS